MEYQIYKIENYSNAPKNRWDSFKLSLPIEEICKLIEEDKGYNERIWNNDVINGTSIVKVFFDIEQPNYKIETIIDALIDIFKNLGLELSKREIKYTINDFKYKDGVKLESFHISIPKYYSNVNNLKFFIKEFKKYNIEIDASPYGNLWFRLPNQTGISAGQKKQPHKIINGKIKDFVLHYIDKTNSKNITKILVREEEVKVKVEAQLTLDGKKVEAQLTLDGKKVKAQPILKGKKEGEEEKTSTPSGCENLDLLLNGLTVDWLDDYLNWIQLGRTLYQIGSTVSKYIEISKRSKKFEDGACEKKWATFKKNTFTIDSIWRWVHKCNIEYWEQLKVEKAQLTLEGKEREKLGIIKIDKKFLTDKDEDEKLIIDSSLIQYFDDLLINNKHKSINIKSPYGSSKTQLIHKVIEQYNPKKILWLSFRKTLSDDIMKNFKDLNFVDYRFGRLDSDRLIIQLESLLKLEDFEEEEEDETTGEVYKIIHKYDLIMMDEIESLLNQFNSEATFSGKARRTFEYLEQLLKKTDNIISLDGDLGQRSYHFLNHFDKCLNIENLNKRNDKTLYFTNQQNEYDNEMFKLLDEDKKIAIASMTVDKCNHYYELLKIKYPNKNIGIYTGRDNSNRKDLKNVNEEWLKRDIVIYSPTITAGVSFDIEKHFYKIFAVISSGSCCQRDFLQMLARIRNPIENKITIFNDGITGKLKCFFTFDEVKQSLIETRKLKVVYKDGKSKMDLDLTIFDINSIFNEVEKLNKIEPLFLQYLFKIASEKGYKIEHSEYVQNKDEAKEQKKQRDEFIKTLDTKIDKLQKAEIIGNSEFETLLKKQLKQEEDTDEHFKISKAVLSKQIGLNFENDNPLTEILIKNYYNCSSSIKNFSYLIDETNIKDIDDNFTENKRKQVFLIKEFFNDMGIKSIYDNNEFTYDEFTKKLENLNIFKPENQIIFHTGKKKFEYTTIKEKYINTLLKNYKLTFSIGFGGRQKVNKNKIYTFSRLHDIEEIIYYKKEKKHIKDTHNLVKKPEILKFKELYVPLAEYFESLESLNNIDEGIDDAIPTVFEKYEFEKPSILGEILDEETISNVPMIKKKVKVMKEKVKKEKTKTVIPEWRENETEQEYRQRYFEKLVIQTNKH